jgi:hypothetical protein
MCNGNTADCNGQTADGCEVDLTQPATCGTCGNNCNSKGWQHVMNYSCSSGTCGIGMCVNGYADCDTTASTGCEVDLSTPQHCGSCGKDCTNPGLPHVMTYTCSAGTCGIGMCANGYADCDTMVSTGCEQATNANPNCGSCGNDCSVNTNNTACVSSACGCSNYMTDCATNSSDRCTSSMCACGSGGPCDTVHAQCMGGACLLKKGENCTAPGQCISNMCNGGKCG